MNKSVSLYDALSAAIRAERPAALATVVAGIGRGAKLLAEPGQPHQGSLGDPDLVEGRPVERLRYEFPTLD